MEFQSKVKKKILSGQSREIISSVLKFMQEESKAERPIIPLLKVQERVSRATGVGLRTVGRISNEATKIEEGEASSFSTPGKKRKVIHTKAAIDDTDKHILRSIITNLYVTEKKVPTVGSILTQFQECTNYQGGIDSLRKAIHKLGFHWRKTKKGRRILMEKHDIKQLRLKFLRNMKTYRKKGHPIVYMDETYINATHTQPRMWSDNTTNGLHKSSPKGQALIIVHAGGEGGFVKNACLMFKSSTTTDDHSEMGFENYKKWLEEKLVPNLPNQCVIVIDNVPYHNVLAEKCPTSGNRKEELRSWLRRKNVPFNDTLFKAELYELIKTDKSQHEMYEIDSILLNKGHNVLRLPPHHSDLNPLKLVWASLRQYVKQHSTNFILKDIQKQCLDFFEQFSLAEWKSRCEYVIKCENEFMENEATLDLIVDDLIISLGECESDTETDFESDSIIEDYDDTSNEHFIKLEPPN